MTSPIVIYNTHELDRACNLILLQYPSAKIWRHGEGFGSRNFSRDIIDAIKIAADAVADHVLILRNAQMLFEGMYRYRAVEVLIDAFYKLIKKESLLFLVGEFTYIPSELRDYCEFRTLPPITSAEITALALTLNKDVSDERVRELKSLSYIEAYRALVYDSKHISSIKQPKTNTLITRVQRTAPQDIAGFHIFRDYYTKISQKALQVGLKGIMMVGVHGCGKTLSVNLVASAMGLDVYRINVGSIMNQYIGESENRVVQALSELKRCAPVIALIDEADKVLSGYASSNQVDAGVMSRIMAEFLYTLDEDTDIVFFLTCNNIDLLPPELIRRLDDIWFVDLPSRKTIAELFSIYFRKYNLDQSIDSDLLEIAEGLTCSEIATGIRRGVMMGNIRDGLLSSTPLAKLKSEELTRLREWAENKKIRRVEE